MSWGASVNPRGVLLYSWSAWICGLVEFRMMRPDFLVSKWCTRLPSWVCSTWLQSINHILDLLFCLSALKAGRRTSTTQPWHSSPSNIGQLGHFAFHLINLLILMQKSHTVSGWGYFTKVQKLAAELSQIPGVKVNSFRGRPSKILHFLTQYFYRGPKEIPRVVCCL